MGSLENSKTKMAFDDNTIRCLFGHEAAEDESIDRLKQYYLKSEIYDSMKSRIPLYILVGHKGIGKSALLKVLSLEDADHGNIAINIRPDDITDLDLANDDFLKQIRGWKEGLSTIIFKKLIESLRDDLPSEKSKSSFININWRNRFYELTASILGVKFVDLQKSLVGIKNSDFVILLKDSLFNEKKITIYIDDLDRGWVNSKADVRNLSAMLNAVRDISRDINNLCFRVALRSDVYYSVRTSDETTDKIDGSVLWQKWSNHEILVMLIKRIETYFGRTIDEQLLLSKQQNEIGQYLHSIFEASFQGAGHWKNCPIHRIIMSLIRKRPRDLIKLCTLAARKAYGNHHDLILTNDLESIFTTYSNDRLTDTGNEYQSEFPQIKELLLKMKPSQKEISSGYPCLFSRASLVTKLKNVLSMSHFSFGDGRTVDEQSLAAFLYKINFLTARKDSKDKIQRIYYDENQYIYNVFSDFGYDFEIHPAYRWALQPNTTTKLFEQIQLEE
jgi:hypothetical protein